MSELLIKKDTLDQIAKQSMNLAGKTEGVTTATIINDLTDVNVEVNSQFQLIEKIMFELGLIGPEADTLDGCSWDNINTIASIGQAKNFWAVGDCKAVTVNGTVGTLSVNQTYYVYILGFDHNGTINTIDFGTFKTALSNGINICLIDSKYGNSSTNGTKYFNINHWGNTNHGGWSGCDLRYDILGSTDVAPSGYGSAPVSGRVGYDATETCATNPVPNTLMAALPAELRAVMKPMTIYTDNIGGGNAESHISATVDYLPLLAEFDIYGVCKYANTYEQNHQS